MNSGGKGDRKYLRNYKLRRFCVWERVTVTLCHAMSRKAEVRICQSVLKLPVSPVELLLKSFQHQNVW